MHTNHWVLVIITKKMKYKVNNKLACPPIIIGCWQLSRGHSDRFNQDAIFTQLDRYCSNGFTTFDCGDIYTGVEEILGTFRNYSGYDFRVNTKFVPDLDALPTLSKEYVERIVNRSLYRLKVECLDLVQFHWWDYNIPGYVDAAFHLAELQQAGKIAQIGVTNFDAQHLAELIEAGVPIVSNQVQYSVLDQRPKKNLLGFAADHDVQLLCYGTLAGGLLSNQWLEMRAEDFSAQTRSHTKYQLVIEDIGGWNTFQALLQRLDVIASKYQTSIAAVANAYIISQTHCSAIVGFSYQNRLNELQQALALQLDTEDTVALKKAISSLAQLEGDVYELERNRTGRHGTIMKYNLNQE